MTFSRLCCSAPRSFSSNALTLRNISLYHDQLHRSQNRTFIHRSKFKAWKEESSAAKKLLSRSNFNVETCAFFIQPRYISTSIISHSSEKNKKDDDEDKNRPPSILFKGVIWGLTIYIAIVTLAVFFSGGEQGERRYVSWTEFVHQMLAKGEVEELIVRPEFRPDVNIVTIVLRDGAIIGGKKAEQKVFNMTIPNVHTFEEKLREVEAKLGIRSDDGIEVRYQRGGETLQMIVLSLLLLGLLAMLGGMRGGSMMQDLNPFSQVQKAKFTLIDPGMRGSQGVKFSDVAGLYEAKQEVMEFVDYLKRPNFYQQLGAKVPKGALLLGPPGCGKTMLAKAVATEASVPFLAMNGTEFIELIGGLGASRVRSLFKEARKRAPCIIYIDEIDAIGRKRSQNLNMSNDEEAQTLNQLLVEMDGMASQSGVIMLSSTNRAEVLDKALLRPGRFDRHILIDRPNLKERKEIFEQHLKQVVLEHEPSYYSQRMSALTPGFSGADIANICNEAALHAARYKQNHVTGADLEYAVERVVGGTEKRTQVIGPSERRVIAYHEAGHALVGWLLEHTDGLLKVTIVPRTNHTLGFAQYSPVEKYLYSQHELFDRMCMALGGRVAESLTFNKVTSGAMDDLRKVTQMAYGHVRSFGMSETVGHLSFPEKEEGVGRRPFSKKLANIMDAEARRLITDAYRTTEKVLQANKDKLVKLAEALLEKETLDFTDVEHLIGPPTFKKRRYIEPAEFEAALNQQANLSKEDDSTSRLL